MRITGPDGADLLVVGSYTEGSGGHGLGVRTFWQHRSGALTPVAEHQLDSPSCVIWHPRLPILYAASESAAGQVTALEVTAAGALVPRGTSPTGGAEPCHLAVSTGAEQLVVANYGSGSVGVIALAETGVPGELTDTVVHSGRGPVPGRQDAAHPHLVLCPAGDRVQIVDLGADEIVTYSLSAAGTLSVHDIAGLPAGTGPRQLRYSPDRRTAYVVGELSNELLTLRVGQDGQLALDSSVPATRSSVRNLPAHLELSEDGRFGYLSNRGADTIALFDLLGRRPSLLAEYDAGGRWPRQFLLAGGRLHAAIQYSDLITTFTVDARSGALSRQGLCRSGTPTWIARPPRAAPGDQRAARH